MSDLIVRTYAADIVYKDAKERMVYAIATGPKKDLDGQGCDPTWLRTAVPDWMKRGNIRLMHNPTIPPVGKATQAVETPDSEWAIAIKVTDDKAWQMVEDDVLTGISIGAKNATIVSDPRFPKGLIKGGDLIEMSLVDYPSYTSSRLAKDSDALGVTFYKRAGNSTYYNGAIIEDEIPESVAGLVNKVAGSHLEMPAAVRQRLEAQRQSNDETRAHRMGEFQNPYAGKPTMIVPNAADGGKAAIADLKKVEEIGKVSKVLVPDRDGFLKQGYVEVPTKDAKEKAVVPDTFKVVASREHGLVLKYGDGDFPLAYLPTPIVDESGKVSFQGDESKHTAAANAVIAALKQLTIQEMQEDEIEFADVACLADIARQFLAFVWEEQMEGETDVFMDEMAAATVSLAAEPDRTKRRDMATAITNSLSKLSKTSTTQEKIMATDTDAATDAEKAAKGGAGDASKAPAKDSKDDGPTGGESAEGSDEGEDGDGDDMGKRTGKKSGAPAKAAEPDVTKVGKTISRATAKQLLELANTPGTPAGVKAALEQLAGFDPIAGANRDGTHDDMWVEVTSDGTDSSGKLPRATIDAGANAFGEIMAEVSASFVTPTGKAATPDVEKVAGADLFKSNVQKIASEAAADVLQKFVTSDAFVEAISKGVQASVDATKAADAAKVAAEGAADLSKEAKADVEKVRKELGDEIERIKKLPAPAKGQVAEGTVAVDKSFVANPDVEKAATPDSTATSLGAAIMKRALAGDPSAQRVLREAIQGSEPGAGQDAAAKATYAKTVTGK